jgi:hypothetical protein
MEKKMAKVTTFDRHGVPKPSYLKDTGLSIQIDQALDEIESKYEDDCPACEESLYYSPEITSRIAIMDDQDEEIIGWICPNCFSQFDMQDSPVILLSRNNIQAES